MAVNLTSILGKILPPKRLPDAGTAVTETFNKSNTDNILALPAYREHLTDIFSSRSSLDSRALIQDMFRTDPDMSAAVNAFLTVADTEPIFVVRDITRQIDLAGQEIFNQVLTALTQRLDYTKGFKITPTLTSIAEAARYMLLLRGGVASELVINKEFYPSEVRTVDLGKLEWFEKAPAQFTPRQRSLTGDLISLDVPNFFVSWFRKDPTTIYSYSPFVSAINTIAARQQVINDLYRIMKVTGYPRMEVIVVEEVIMKTAPPNIKAATNPEVKQTYINGIIGNIRNAISSLRPDQTFIHTDSIETKVLNEKTPGMAIDISSVIETLNAQNQAGLKTMATIIGRGESGVNTASVEARVFSLNAQALNEPIADHLSQMFTLAIRLLGSTSYVECRFRPVEMRSDSELEPNLLIKKSRLSEDLSLGLITDVEYHLEMYGRLPPPGTPTLSGTGFLAAKADPTAITPDNGSVSRAATPAGGKGTKPLRDTKTKPSGAK